MLTTREARDRLRQLVSDRAHVYDEDFRQASLTTRTEAKLLREMTEAGYQIGRTEDNQNEWWPPDKVKGDER